MNTKSQCEEILRHLQSGKSISPLEALEKFGCMRLGGRVFELKQRGYKIVTEMVTKNGKRYAEYRFASLGGNQSEHRTTERGSNPI